MAVLTQLPPEITNKYLFNKRETLSSPGVSYRPDFRSDTGADQYISVSKDQAIQFVTSKALEFESSPERQKMYALLENRELCIQLMSSSSKDEDLRTQKLREYFTQHPINMIGLIEHLKALANVLEGLDKLLTKQVTQLLNSPRKDDEFHKAVALLVIMHKSIKDLRTSLAENPEPFLQGLRQAKELFKAFKTPTSQKLMFSGRRETANKKLKEIGEVYSLAVAGAAAGVGAIINAGVTATAVPSLGIIPAIVGYAKLAKAINGNHNEVEYYGKSLTDDLLNEVFARESPDEPHWANIKKFIYKNLKKFQLPWEVLGPIEKHIDNLDDLDELKSAFKEFSEAGATIIDRGFRAVAHFNGEHPPIWSDILKQYYPNVKTAFLEFHGPEMTKWFKVLSDMHSDHLNWDALEKGFSAIAHDIETVDDAIPVVGLLMSAWKGAALYQNGAQVSKIVHRDKQSRIEYLESHATEMETSYKDIFTVGPKIFSKSIGFVKEYFRKPEDYNPFVIPLNFVKKIWNAFSGSSSEHDDFDISDLLALNKSEDDIDFEKQERRSWHESHSEHRFQEPTVGYTYYSEPHYTGPGQFNSGRYEHLIFPDTPKDPVERLTWGYGFCDLYHFNTLNPNMEKDGAGLLHTAILFDEEAVVENLIKRGANVNRLSYQGNTPLTIVARTGNIRLAKKLIEAGANITKANEKGNTPFYYALKYKNKEVANYLYKKGAKIL